MAFPILDLIGGGLKLLNIESEAFKTIWASMKYSFDVNQIETAENITALARASINAAVSLLKVGLTGGAFVTAGVMSAGVAKTIGLILAIPGAIFGVGNGIGFAISIFNVEPFTRFDIYNYHQINIKTPNSATIWVLGQPILLIEWQNSGIEGNVKIEMYKGENKVVDITNQTENDGNFRFNLSNSIAIGNNYRVRVVPLSDQTLSNFSDYFEIKNYETNYGWSTLNSGSENFLEGVSAVNEFIVWVCGSDGTILRTINGGETWENAGDNKLTESIHNIFGWDDQLAFCSSGSSVYRTSDGGNSWTEVLSNRRFINSIWMNDENNGYCFGDPDGGYWDLLTTSDGGVTWNTLSSLAANDGELGVNNSLFVNGNDIYFGTMSGYKICHSTDGGNSWAYQITPNSLSAAIWFNKYGKGMEGGDDLAQTVDGGNNWSLISHPHIGGIFAITGRINEWWYESGGMILYSSDNGTNWEPQYTPTNTIRYFVQSRNIINYFTIWEVGWGGEIAEYLTP